MFIEVRRSSQAMKGLLVACDRDTIALRLVLDACCACYSVSDEARKEDLLGDDVERRVTRTGGGMRRSRAGRDCPTPVA